MSDVAWFTSTSPSIRPQPGRRSKWSTRSRMDRAPRWLLRDRDSIYGDAFHRRVTDMGIAEVVSSPMRPWQSPYVERWIGSIRRECLDHVIVINRTHLCRVLRSYIS